MAWPSVVGVEVNGGGSRGGTLGAFLGIWLYLSLVLGGPALPPLRLPLSFSPTWGNVFFPTLLTISFSVYYYFFISLFCTPVYSAPWEL